MTRRCELAVEGDRDRDEAREGGDTREDQQRERKHVDRIVGAGLVDAEALELEAGLPPEDLMRPRVQLGHVGRATARTRRM